MSAWPLVDLEEVSDISAGNPAPQDANHFCADGHPFVRMQDVGRKHIDPALVETTDRVSSLAVRECGLRLYPAGTLLIPKSGASVNLNHRAMLGLDAYVVSHLATIIPDQRKVLPSYLFHWSQRYDPRSQAQVTSLPSLPLSLIKAAKVPLPPLDEQRRIVGLLDRAAEIRRRADAARAKARAIIPALFLDMFGDPATNPKGWRTLRLGDALLTGLQNGLYRPASDYGEGTRILRIDSFDDGKIGDQRRLKRLRIDTASIKKFGLHEGDIIVNRVNSPPQLGKSVLIHKLDEPTVFESNMMRMQVDPEILIPAIVGVMLQIPSVRQNLIRNAKHAINQSSINQSDVTAVGVFAPPLTLQTDFAEQAQRIEATARALDAAAAKAEAMAAGLSAEVFGSA
ncbi:restriction endonuclease subunit S [Acidiphilium sp.]|uniref:restriction endonuclease subunit S n=1 Tax=Acidiphilium sp. TaxID=527 RepID=UPI0025867872|nr:restriction endonuclease subunit S [Acidiphilium sp.]